MNPKNHDMIFWRRGLWCVAASAGLADEMYLEQCGYTRITPDQTYPAVQYYLPGSYDAPASPHTWERATDTRAARRGEYCPICGLHRPTGVCKGHRDRKGRQTHVWRPEGRARYYAEGDAAVGSAHTAKHEWAYLQARWIRIRRVEACWLSTQGARCTMGGPDREVSPAEFRAVAQYRNKQWQEIIP
ncbi:MAG: hypothetical protein ABFD89_12580 [Bryobacteraceae bacterium]